MRPTSLIRCHQAHSRPGLTECVLSGYNPASGVSVVATSDEVHSVMSVKGKKVLHIDRNDHYGGFVRHLYMHLILFN